MNLKRITALLLAIALQLALLAGGIPAALAEGAPQIPGLTFVAETPLEYAPASTCIAMKGSIP